MKLKVEFVDWSIKVIKAEHIFVDLNPIFNDLNFRYNNLKEEHCYPLELVSRVTVDGEIIYDHMGRKENHKKEKENE